MNKTIPIQSEKFDHIRKTVSFGVEQLLGIGLRLIQIGDHNRDAAGTVRRQDSGGGIFQGKALPGV